MRGLCDGAGYGLRNLARLRRARSDQKAEDGHGDAKNNSTISRGKTRHIPDPVNGRFVANVAAGAHSFECLRGARRSSPQPEMRCEATSPQRLKCNYLKKVIVNAIDIEVAARKVQKNIFDIIIDRTPFRLIPSGCK